MRLERLDKSLARLRPSGSSTTLHVVYQMRNQLCQLLFQQAENLLGAVQTLVGGKLFEAKRPVEDRGGSEVPHRALDRMRRPVQQLPVDRVDCPSNLVDPPRMLFEKRLGDVAEQIAVARTDFERRLPINHIGV